MKICGACKGGGMVNYEICDVCDGEGVDIRSTFILSKTKRKMKKDEYESENKKVKFDKKNAIRSV